MADISAVFGILLALGIAFPGLLTAWWLLLPGPVERARARLEQTPWLCFWLGGLASALTVVPIAVLLSLSLGPAKLLGCAIVVSLLAVASLGAAGLAAHMGQRLLRASPGQTALGAFVRGALALELAAAFPVIGWFFVVPLATVVALGATLFALMGWGPAPARPAAFSQPAEALASVPAVGRPLPRA